MEKWNELCYILSENLPTNTSEQLFELKVIRAFEKLGWSEYNNEIIVRESIQLGASNRISPDLVFRSAEKGNLFIVEVKKPSVDVGSTTYRGQLSSYMGIMRVDFGLLIGNKIQLFVDGKYFNKNEIVLIEEIEFQRDNEKGYEFVKLFDRDNYDEENIINLAQEKLRQLQEIEESQKLKKQLLGGEYNERIIEFLKTQCLQEFDQEVIEKVFEELNINIERKVKLVAFTNDETASTISHDRKSKTYNGVRNIDTSGKLPIGIYVRTTFSELVKDNLIGKEEIQKLQRRDYSKMTFGIQFPFLAKESSDHYERVRYWKNPYYINGEMYYVCSQWYEVPANNDRPYYEAWLKKMRSNRT